MLLPHLCCWCEVVSLHLVSCSWCSSTSLLSGLVTELQHFPAYIPLTLCSLCYSKHKKAGARCAKRSGERSSVMCSFWQQWEMTQSSSPPCMAIQRPGAASTASCGGVLASGGFLGGPLHSSRRAFSNFTSLLYGCFIVASAGIMLIHAQSDASESSVPRCLM